MHVPLVDLSRQHEQIGEGVAEGLATVFASASFIGGPEVGEFERNLAAFMERGHCVGVGNGTDALEFALRALGVGRGDTAVLPANTFVATALAVVRAGARVELVDCDPETKLMDPSLLDRAMHGGVSVVIPVHLYGQMAPMAAISEVVGDRAIIEDGAQSHGASQRGFDGSKSTSILCTSFYPGKNLGAYGDGGAVLANDPEIAAQVRRLGNWGSTEKYHHPSIGFNSRLDTIQAVVLSEKLRHLSRWNEERRNAADFYNQLLADLPGVVPPTTAEGNVHVWHLYVVEVDHRDDVMRRLNAAGVGAGVHYPLPVHLHGAFSFLGHEKGSFPNAERASERILSLPIFPGITEDEQRFVVESLEQAIEASE